MVRIEQQPVASWPGRQQQRERRRDLQRRRLRDQRRTQPAKLALIREAGHANRIGIGSGRVLPEVTMPPPASPAAPHPQCRLRIEYRPHCRPQHRLIQAPGHPGFKVNVGWLDRAIEIAGQLVRDGKGSSSRSVRARHGRPPRRPPGRRPAIRSRPCHRLPARRRGSSSPAGISAAASATSPQACAGAPNAPVPGAAGFAAIAASTPEAIMAPRASAP